MPLTDCLTFRDAKLHIFVTLFTKLTDPLMRSAFCIALTVVLTTSFWSCKNDLDVNDDWKEVPVVYGLLDPNETTHIVKITKAFLGAGNALYMASNPDSSYYGTELEPQLVELNPDGSANRIWNLDTMWIHDKESGTFFSGDQMLYKVNADLRLDKTYRLVARNNHSGLLAFASTTLVGSVTINRPRSSFLSFTSTAETQVELQSAQNGKVYQIVIRFYYVEVDLTTNDSTTRYIDWPFPNRKSMNLGVNEKILYSYIGSNFYSNIQAKVKEDINVKRIPGNVHIIAYVGGEELSTYIDITSPITTIVQERPQYTNINNGIGIFSSRTSNLRAYKLTVASIDSLVNGSKTYSLGFVKP